MSDFIREQVGKRLIELRKKCAIEKNGVRHATDPKAYWGSDSPGSTYWADLKAKCARERPAHYESACKALEDYIREHAAFLPADLVETGHGRQCWAPFLGGVPIGQFYCELDEGHAGPCRSARGYWPNGVRNIYDWKRLLDTLPPGSTGLESIPASESIEPFKSAKGGAQ